MIDQRLEDQFPDTEILYIQMNNIIYKIKRKLMQTFILCPANPRSQYSMPLKVKNATQANEEASEHALMHYKCEYAH